MTRFSIAASTDHDGLTTKSEETKIEGSYYFESGEHESIGDSIWLKYKAPDKVSGKDFKYTVGSNALSFGHIVALAGDFYGSYQYRPGDAEQISDKWDTDSESSIRLGQKVAGELSGDAGGYLAKVLATMTEEETTVRNRIALGQDVAQASIFADISEKYGNKYNSDTALVSISPVGAYAVLAQCNWDHFGQDAYKAYSALHTSALRKAKEANQGPPGDVDKTMKDAYFFEAYAQHFLTDLFSSGHLRVPRRTLHENIIWPPDAPEVLNMYYAGEPYYADLCSLKMHNEDCANGLWVHNKQGQSWATYGDRQLWSPKSNQNFIQAQRAAQAGVDEVWNTCETGVIPAAKDFAALQLTPTLENIDFYNYYPLFVVGTSAAKRVSYRTNIDNRSDSGVTRMSENPWLLGEWRTTHDKIAESGEDQNMYPFTQGFLSTTSFVHVREAPVWGSLLENLYGDLASGTFDATWTMVTQFNPPLATSQATSQLPIEWVHAASVSSDVRSLVGRTMVSGKWNSYHLGIRRNVALWTDQTNVEAADYVLRDVIYANFKTDMAQIGMAKYFDDGSGGLVEIWALDSSFKKSPTKGAKFPTAMPLRYTVAHQLDYKDTYKTWVGWGGEQQAEWYFSTWTDDYQKSNWSLVRYNLGLSPKSADALLSVDWSFESAGHRLLAVFIQNTEIHFAAVNAKRTSESKIELTISNRNSFNITWNVVSPEDYLLWISDDGFLVTLVMSTDSKMLVVTFPLSISGGDPTFTPIQLASLTVGTLLTAPFLKQLRAMQASYTYPATQGGGTTNRAIMMFFDNYGVLGARMIAPVTKDSASYEFKGQLPAISGQPSKALGMTPARQGHRSQAIGIFPGDVKICEQI